VRISCGSRLGSIHRRSSRRRVHIWLGLSRRSRGSPRGDSASNGEGAHGECVHLAEVGVG